MTSFALLLVGSFAAAPLACSSSPPSTQAATLDLATAECHHLAQCDPVGMQQWYANDVNTCATQLSASLTASYSFYGSGATSATVEACANAVKASSCGDSFGALAACKTPPGTLPNGTSCATSAQCAAGQCFVPTANPGACGTCTAVSSTNVCRYDSQCPGGQICGQGTCLTPGALGASCGGSSGFVSNWGCRADLTCSNAGFSAGPGAPSTGTCVARGAAGASCTYGGCAAGLVCSTNGTSVTNATCVAPKIIPLGGQCDPTQAGSQAQICAGGSCVGGFVGGTVTGTCVALAAAGANCGGPGPACQSDLMCVAGTCTAYKTQDKCGNALVDGG
jgi:hypothetical protein